MQFNDTVGCTELIKPTIYQKVFVITLNEVTYCRFKVIAIGMQFSKRFSFMTEMSL